MNKKTFFLLIIFSFYAPSIYAEQGNPAILARNRMLDQRLRKPAPTFADVSQKRLPHSAARQAAVQVPVQSEKKQVIFAEEHCAASAQLKECKKRYDELAQDYNTLAQRFQKTVEMNKKYEEKLTLYEQHILPESKKTIDLCMGNIDRLARRGFDKPLTEQVPVQESALYKRALQILFSVDDMVKDQQINPAQFTLAFNNIRGALLGLVKPDEILKSDILYFDKWLTKIAQNLLEAAERIEQARPMTPSSSVNKNEQPEVFVEKRSDSPKPMDIDKSAQPSNLESPASARKRKIQENKKTVAKK